MGQKGEISNSLTLDNEIEFIKQAEVGKQTGVKIYFMTYIQVYKEKILTREIYNTIKIRINFFLFYKNNIRIVFHIIFL